MRLEISQQQKQIISPMMMQTLDLLTIPILDLAERLENEAEKNPLIELEYQVETQKKDNSVDEETENKFQDSSDTGFDKSHRKDKTFSDFDSQSYLENLTVEKESLSEYIMEQIHTVSLISKSKSFTKQDLNIAEMIISSLDNQGFLPFSPAELAKHLSVSVKDFERVRKRIQQLDPIGVASLNFREFLMIQVKYYYGQNSLEFKIVSECVDLLEKKLFTKIANQLKVDNDDVHNAVNNIKKLNVYPAVNYTTEAVRYIIPDAVVKVENDNIKLTLNDEYIPNIKLNQHYLNIYSDSKPKKKKSASASDKNTYDFLKENIESAKILIENLKSRKEIIFKVILKIVEKQKDYFIRGEQYQVPLKLKDIADELDIHESTVSRAIKEKYIHTERGIVSLKSFFSTQIGTDDVSANSVKEIMKKIIDAEDKNSPLSDDKIVRILKNKGIVISRRTVAKYRGEFNIPAAYIRRNPL